MDALPLLGIVSLHMIYIIITCLAHVFFSSLGCAQIEKKPYFPVFLLTGFVGFDGKF
jgi:hypothetical protein